MGFFTGLIIGAVVGLYLGSQYLPKITVTDGEWKLNWKTHKDSRR